MIAARTKRGCEPTALPKPASWPSAPIKALADQQAANVLPVIREIQKTGGLGV